MKGSRGRWIGSLILAGGRSSRMRSEVPKFFHPVAHYPLVYYVWDVARDLDVPCVTVCSPSHRPRFQTAWEEYPHQVGFSHSFTLQPEPRGTGDAVRVGWEALKQQREWGPEDYVAVMMGDTPFLTGSVFQGMVKAWHSQPKSSEVGMVLAGMEAPGPHRYGKFVLAPVQESKEEGRPEVTAIQEWAQWSQKSMGQAPDPCLSDICFSGVCLVQCSLLESDLPSLEKDPATKEVLFTSLVARARAGGRSVLWTLEPYSIALGVNTRQDLAVAEREMQTRLRERAMDQGATLKDPESVFLAWDTRCAPDVEIHPWVVFGPGVDLGPGAKVFSFSHLEASQLQKGATVGPFSRLRGGSVLGEHGTVGNFVEVKGSHLGPGVKAKHLAYLGDAWIGDGANIGAGTVTCNYDGLKKHKTEIGSESFVGANSTLVAPLTLGPSSMVGAGSVVTRSIAEGDLAIGRARQATLPGAGRKYLNKRKSKRGVPGPT